jgi:hypothetical protein
MRAGKTEVSDILKGKEDQLSAIVPNTWKLRTLYALTRCRTARMGGHIDRCDNPKCEKLHLSYNSCRNRHCPKCQGHLREKWIQAREDELLNTSYYHVVFTLPDHLHPLAVQHPSVIYRLLFSTAWSVMSGFAANPKFLGGQAGMIALLHTWGQNLSLHPHVHCIVPAGGLTKSDKWKSTKSNGKFLFPVTQMKSVFRARFMEALRKDLPVDQVLSKKLFAKQWVVFCKQPFFGPKQVIEYLGRYTHKIAISNARILAHENGIVTFRAKDYRHGGKKVILRLPEKEFIRRFALHVLPRGFTRIRHYGILSSSSKKKCKELIDQQIGKVPAGDKKETTMIHICPRCKSGHLVTVAVFDQRGPPGHWKKLLMQQ